MEESLKPCLSESLLANKGGKNKLNKALKKLRQKLEEKPGPGEAYAEAKEVLNLLAGIVASSLPSAISDSTSGQKLYKGELMDLILSNVDESVKDILEENNIVAGEGDLKANVAKLLELAGATETKEGQSIYAAVAECTRSECNGEALDAILEDQGKRSAGTYYTPFLSWHQRSIDDLFFYGILICLILISKFVPYIFSSQVSLGVRSAVRRRLQTVQRPFLRRSTARGLRSPQISGPRIR